MIEKKILIGGGGLDSHCKERSDYLVYFHRNPLTNEVFYVGMGRDRRPYAFHRRGIYWKNYVGKYGKPIVEIVKAGLTNTEARELEKYYIALWGRKGYEAGGKLVNLTLGGDVGPTGYKHTAEAIKKISESSLKKVGWKASDETRAKQSRARLGVKRKEEVVSRLKEDGVYKRIADKLRGRTLSDEMKKKVSEGLKRYYRSIGRVGTGKVGTGKYVKVTERKRLSSETKEKMRANHLKERRFAKKVIDNHTGIIYDAVMDAAKAFNVSMTAMRKWLVGKVKKKTGRFSYYGY